MYSSNATSVSFPHCPNCSYQVLHPLEHLKDAGKAEELLHVAPGEEKH